MSVVLLAGCLSREGGPRPVWPRQHDAPPEASPAPVPPEPAPGPPVPPPEPPLSDYQPRVVAPARQTSMSLDPAVTRASAEVRPAAEPPPPPKPEPPLVAALRCALEKHPDEARRLLDKYEKGDRELLLALLRLTAGVGERELDKFSPDELAAALAQLDALSAHLRKKLPLSLDNVCFCHAIEGFGRYERVPPRRAFQAGSDGRPGERVQVYAEVRNFSRRPAGGQYETVLESKLEIRDAERRKVVTLDLGRCLDRSRSPRQDYFLNFQLHVPPKLPPGLYTLWVTVKDVTEGRPGSEGDRQASCSLDFMVGPPGAPRSGDSAP